MDESMSEMAQTIGAQTIGALREERDTAVSALFDVVHVLGVRWADDDGTRRDFYAIRNDAVSVVNAAAMKERAQWADEAWQATKELAAMTKERDHWATEEARMRALLDRAAEVTAAHRERVRWLEATVLELAARSVGVGHG